MVGKMKKVAVGGRLEWLVLVLLVLVAMLFGDAFRAQGIFRSQRANSFCVTNTLSGRFSKQAPATKPVEPSGPVTSVVNVQPNFHMVTPGIWRSAKLNPESLERMKSYKLKTIVNLRLDNENEPWEDTLAKKLGIQCFHFPISPAKVVPAKTVDAVLSILSDPARQPVLVHCAAGRDRSGMIIAAYRIAHKEWSFSDIYQEMMMYGYANIQLPAMLKTLELWSTAQGRPEIAQEIALTEQKIVASQKPISIKK